MLNYFDLLSSFEGISQVEKKEKSKRDWQNSGEVFNFKYLDFLFEIYIDNDFPLRLPNILRLDGPFHCHINKSGTVCLVNQEDVSYDINNPQEVFLSYLNCLKKLLNMAEEECEKEILAEYNDYLENFSNFDEKKCYLFKEELEGKLAVEDNSITIGIDGIFVKEHFKDKSITQRNYLKLNLSRVPTIKNDELLSTDILECLTSESLTKIKKYHSKSVSQFFLLKYNNEDDIDNYILIETINNSCGLNNELLNNQAKLIVRSVDNCTPSFLARRGGAILNSKKILLLGVGSVGGEVLEQLASSGFTDITIVDKDNYNFENGFRNCLGFLPFKKLEKYSKTYLLKFWLEWKYPTLNCTEFHNDLISLLKEKRINVDDYDYIISCLGNPIINQYLNKLLYSFNKNNKIIYAWLEPYGVAEHILCVNTRKKGCFDCYLKSTSSINLVSGDENYRIRNHVCSGSFTPYGKCSCVRLAANVVETILLDSQGLKPIENMHIVKKGSNILFLNHGYKKTNNMLLSQDEIDKRKKDFIFEGCDICGKCDY